MDPLTLLRRLAEQHSYQALKEACAWEDGSRPEICVLTALAEARLGHPGTARALVDHLQPPALDTDTQVDLAAVHIALGDRGRAEDILEAARAEAPHHALLLARLGWCRQQTGDLTTALELYEQSLAIEPRLAVYLNLLRLYRDLERYTDMAACLNAAEAFWTQARSDWPEDRREQHTRELRALHLDLLLADEEPAALDAWIKAERADLNESGVCALLADVVRALLARDRHTDAEEWLQDGLAQHPDSPDLHRQLAELAELCGRTRQALALLNRAVHLARKRGEPVIELRIQQAATALQIEPALARSTALSVLEELRQSGSPQLESGDQQQLLSIRAETVLADAESRLQAVDAAEARYRRVLASRPDDVPALSGFGQLLVQLGRMDEAEAIFKRIRERDPVRGHAALINIRRPPGDDDTLLRLESLARQPTAQGSVNAPLLFQLAAAWERRGDYERAFALANEANTAIRKLLRYDPKAHRQHCARIRHAFPRALFDARAGCGLPTTVPVFIVGMPRSGTTLIEQIIAGHSRVHGAGELGTLPRIIAGLERWERMTGSGRHFPDCVDDLDPAVTRGIAERVLAELQGYAPDASHVVDKLPHNFEHIGLIRLLFPNARIISVRRDPRDIAISNFFTDYAARHGGMGFAYDLDWIGEQLADHNLLMHHWHQVFPDGILEVRYEDVLDDPEGNARRLLDHIGVDWEEAALDFTRLDRPVRTASAWQVRQPLYTSARGRWRHYQNHLAPLIAAANREIHWAPIDMVTLPEPGLLNTGVDHYRRGDLDGAERQFKKLLHHLPEHAAARHMLGLVYIQKGHLDDGVALMESAQERCPWNRNWKDDLARAYRIKGQTMAATRLAAARPPRSAGASLGVHSRDEAVTD